MIVDDYEAIAEQLKRIQADELRSVKSQKELDDDFFDQLMMGNEEETAFDYHDVYVGYAI
jgi:hypothetical protein